MRKKLIAALLTLVLTFGFSACQTAGNYDSFSAEVFGENIVFSALLLGGKTKKAGNEMKALLQEVNTDMSTSLSSSGISELNARTTEEGVFCEPVEVNQITFEVVKKAVSLYELTDGAFNIAVGPLSKLWKIDNEGYALYGGLTPTDDMIPAPPTYEEVLRVKKDCVLKDADGNWLVRAFEQDGKYYLSKSRSGLQLDLGAIAKGFGADKCYEIAKKHDVKSALIDISSNLYVLGKMLPSELATFTDWEVSLIAPRPLGNMIWPLCRFRTDSDMSFVTSGDYQRFRIYEQGKNNSLLIPHIIDGRTGMPSGINYDADKGYYNVAPLTDKLPNEDIVAEKVPVQTAMVAMQSSMTADALATALCVMGYEQAKIFAKENNLQSLIVSGDGRLALCNIGAIDTGEGLTLNQTDRFKEYQKYRVEYI